MPQKEQRNIGIIGAPSSDTSEVFAAILRHGITPPAPLAPMSNENPDIEDKPKPYDAKKRKHLVLFSGND